MATPGQVQKLVARIQAMEAREEDGRAREQVLHGTVQDLTNRLATQQQQIATPAPAASTFATGTVDTWALGKPEVFEGNEAKWHDFRVVFKAYCSCVNQRLERRKLFNAALLHPSSSSLSTTTAYAYY
eukprot:4097243-Amphidinium_carterae.1